MSFRSFILRFDIYSRPPSLLINKKSSHSTCPGLIFSMLTYALFLYLFFSTDFVQDLNPKVLTQLSLDQSPPTLQIGKNSFPIFFSLNDELGNIYNDSSIFELKIELLRFQKNVTSEVWKFGKIEEKRVGLRACEKNDFINSLTVDQEELNIISEKLNLTCLQDEDLKINGEIEGREISEIVITITPCQNETSDVICRSEEEINKFFASTKTASLVYIDFNEDLEKFENPMRKKLKWINYKINCGQQRQNLIKMKETFFKTISGISNEQTIIFLKPDEFIEDFLILEPNPKALLYIVLQVSRNYDKITRTYQTIGEALASVVTIVHIFGAVIKIFMMYFQNILYKLDILNRLYSFDTSEKKQKKEQISLKYQDKFPPKDRLNISIWRAFVADMKKLFGKKTNNEEKLYLKTESILRRETNLPYILQKLHEIEKIKLLVFDKYQLFIFNFLSKPTLFIPNSNTNEDLNYSKLLGQSLEFFDKFNIDSKRNLGVYEAELKENITKLINSNKKIDKKFFFLLDEKFKNLCVAKNETSCFDVPDEKI